MNGRKQWRQWEAKDMMKGVIAIWICIGVLCFSVFAEEDGPTSNVWLDVVKVPTEARISVTVPLSYGFAVIGSMEATDNIPVSMARENLLLPNIRVVVTEPSAPGGGAVYEVQAVSESSIPLRNYSTDVREEYADEELPPREGLPVAVKPYMIAVQDKAGAIQYLPVPTPHYWQPSATDPTWDDETQTADEAKVNFKKFQMRLDDLAFSIEDQKRLETIAGASQLFDIIWLEDTIALDAPPNVPDYGYTSAGTAQIPSEKYISVEVRVGGMQNQYRQVEQSVKVGAIYWDVIPGELPVLTQP